MATLSLCMIVKNEEDTLARCLNSVKDIADEIIIADTGSTDRTKEIAAGFTDKVFDFPWIDDFSAARNASFERASMDYVLWLDADDVILPDDAARLKRLKETIEPDVDAVSLRYNTGFDEQGRVTFSYSRERLVKRDRGFRWKEPVHEYLEISGRSVETDICVTHAKKKGAPPGRNVRIYENLLAGGQKLTPRGTYYYARELKDNGRFADAAKVFLEFLESGLGWVEDNITGCGELARCRLSLGDRPGALAAMLRSFQYDTPRAELCCQIGYYFKDEGRYAQAAFWFELALGLKRPENMRGFFQGDCWGFIPCLECAVCYDRLGELEKAERFNDLAAGFKPDSPAVLYNARYFASRRSEPEKPDAGGDVSASPGSGP